MKLPRLSTVDQQWTEPEPAPIATTPSRNAAAFRPPPRASTPIDLRLFDDADLIEEPVAFPSTRTRGTQPPPFPRGSSHRLVIPLPGLPPVTSMPRQPKAPAPSDSREPEPSKREHLATQPPVLPALWQRGARRQDNDATLLVRGRAMLGFPTKRSRSMAIAAATAAGCLVLAVALLALSSDPPQRAHPAKPAASMAVSVPAAAVPAAAPQPAPMRIAASTSHSRAPTKPAVTRRPTALAPAKPVHAKKAPASASPRPR